jgi:hypothetical protein
VRRGCVVGRGGNEVHSVARASVKYEMQPECRTLACGHALSISLHTHVYSSRWLKLVAARAGSLHAVVMESAPSIADDLPISASFSHIASLESAAKRLDKPIARIWRHYWSAKTAAMKDEKILWVNFSRAEFDQLYDSRVLHMQGEARMQSLVTAMDLTVARDDLVAIAFWHNLDDTHALPQSIVDGLKSAVIHGGFVHVYLFSYQALTRIPRGVTLVDAADVLPMASFTSYIEAVGHSLGKQSIASVSDLIRLKACAATAHAFAVMIDCDTIWLHSMILPCLAKAYGHVFATHRINQSSMKNLNMKKKLVERQLNYTIEYGDYLGILPPFLFSKDPRSRSMQLLRSNLRW